MVVVLSSSLFNDDETSFITHREKVMRKEKEKEVEYQYRYNERIFDTG